MPKIIAILTNEGISASRAAKLKVGDYVSFKYDIEQGGKILKIVRGPYGLAFQVLASQGGYVDNIHGTVIDLQPRDIWLEPIEIKDRAAWEAAVKKAGRDPSKDQKDSWGDLQVNDRNYNHIGRWSDKYNKGWIEDQ